MSKEKGDQLENNTNEKRYSQHICVSKTVKKYFDIDCVKKIREDYPELENAYLSHNQIQSILIKSYLKIFNLKKYDRNKHNTDIKV